MTIASARDGKWIGYWPSDSEAVLAGVDVLRDLVAQPGTVLKDDHRSFLKRVQFSGIDIVAKQPRDKNRRLWIRVLTWFRRSEVRFTLDTLEALCRAEVPSVTPLAALEYRRLGMVLDSWLFYRYREGVRCGEAQYAEIVHVLNALHRAGLRHEDPHLDNFLYDGKAVFVLDTKGKPRLGRVSDYYDYLLLQERTEGFDAYIEPPARNWSYRLAVWYGVYRQWRRRVKENVRRAVRAKRARR